MSVNAFAKKCELGEGVIRSYLRGTVPGIDKASAIADAAGVNLDWLVTGRGPVRSEPPDAAGASQPLVAEQRRGGRLDSELFGRVTDVIARTYKAVGAALQPVDLGRLAARHYEEIVAASADPVERAAMLKLLAAQIKRELTAAAAEPGTGKRLA